LRVRFNELLGSLLMVSRNLPIGFLSSGMHLDCFVMRSGPTPELTGRGREAHKIMEQFNDERNAIPRSG